MTTVRSSTDRFSDEKTSASVSMWANTFREGYEIRLAELRRNCISSNLREERVEGGLSLFARLAIHGCRLNTDRGRTCSTEEIKQTTIVASDIHSRLLIQTAKPL